jgi:hypothetical protein
MAHFPENKAELIWERDGITYALVKNSNPYLNHYCGYARFAERPVQEESYHGLLTYVPVHGGITFAHADDAGMVYGFDCGHAGDDTNQQRQDIDWLKAECERMGVAIRDAAQYEPDYLAAGDDNDTKAAVIDRYHTHLREVHGITFDLRDNFGAMLNVLFGGNL